MTLWYTMRNNKESINRLQRCYYGYYAWRYQKRKFLGRAEGGTPPCKNGIKRPATVPTNFHLSNRAKLGFPFTNGNATRDDDRLKENRHLRLFFQKKKFFFWFGLISLNVRACRRTSARYIFFSAET